MTQHDKLSVQQLREILIYSLAKDPQNVELMWNLLVADNALGNKDEAIATLERMHTLAPRNPTILKAYEANK